MTYTISKTCLLLARTKEGKKAAIITTFLIDPYSFDTHLEMITSEGEYKAAQYSIDIFCDQYKPKSHYELLLTSF